MRHPTLTPSTQELGASSSRVEIFLTLNRYEEDEGVWAYVWDEATWWMGKRQWVITDDPERGTFEDADFEETPSEIEAELAKASEPYVEDDHSAIKCDPRRFQRW